jgi:hypothetical protein
MGNTGTIDGINGVKNLALQGKTPWVKFVITPRELFRTMAGETAGYLTWVYRRQEVHF